MNNEPVAFVTGGNKFAPVLVDTVLRVGTPLYTHPVKELTDEEILGCWVEEFTGNALPSIDFARAILRKAQEK